METKLTDAANTASDASGYARKMDIPDVEVLDQDGNALHFYSDLIKGKTVAINFIFTNCTTICPPLGATFARVQKEMGDKVGKDVHFISISVDPLTDTPERLKAWGAKFKAGPAGRLSPATRSRSTSCCMRSARPFAPRGSLADGNHRQRAQRRMDTHLWSGEDNPDGGIDQNVMAGKVDESLAKETAKP